VYIVTVKVAQGGDHCGSGVGKRRKGVQQAGLNFQERRVWVRTT
jgi:hypothetical protein